MYCVLIFYQRREFQLTGKKQSTTPHQKKKNMNVVYTDVFVQIQEEKEKIDLLWQETGWTARLDVSHRVSM